MLFIVGAMLLVVPVAAVLLTFANSYHCAVGACLITGVQRAGVSVVPYFMVAGGAILAYVLKRVSDSSSFVEGEEE